MGTETGVAMVEEGVLEVEDFEGVVSEEGDAGELQRVESISKISEALLWWIPCGIRELYGMILQEDPN